MPRLLIHFARYGPYHHARLRAAHEVLSPLGWEVTGLETAGTDATYAWDESMATADGPRVVTTTDIASACCPCIEHPSRRWWAES